jgi:hypothetical protein
MTPSKDLMHREVALNTASTFNDIILETATFFNRISQTRKQEGEVRKCPVRKPAAGCTKLTSDYERNERAAIKLCTGQSGAGL